MPWRSEGRSLVSPRAVRRAGPSWKEPSAASRLAGSFGDRHPEFPQEASHRVQPGGPGLHQGRAHAVKGADGLLLDGLHRYGHDRFAMAGAQDGLGVSPVGLLADTVGLDVLRRKQLDGVAELLRLTPPVVRRAAGLHQDRRTRAAREELHQLPPVQPFPLADAPLALDCDLEDVLGQVDGDRRRILHGLLLFGLLRLDDVGTSMPFHVMKEESTSSLQRTRLRSPLNSISLGYR